MNIKEKITRNFDKASISYDDVDHIQKKCALHLISMIRRHCRNFYPKSILDVGTGTGNIPVSLYQFFPDAEYVLNDISSAMINNVRTKFSSIKSFRFYHGDIEKTNIRTTYDLITSNLCLQWIEHLKDIIQTLYINSHIFAFSCLLDGTFKSWRKRLLSYAISGVVKKYPDADHLIQFLNGLQPFNSHIDFKNFSIEFAKPILLMRYLKALGANTSNTNKKNVNSNLRKLRYIIKTDDRSCSLEYKVIFVILERKQRKL